MNRKNIIKVINRHFQWQEDTILRKWIGHQVNEKKKTFHFNRTSKLQQFFFFIAPGSYSPEKCNLNQQTAFSFGSRPEQKVRSDTPAPNQYAAEKYNFSRTPSFTMCGRRKVEKPDSTPGELLLTFDAVFFRLNNEHIFSLIYSSGYIFTREMCFFKRFRGIQFWN